MSRKRSSRLRCVLTGGHRWVNIGGITFEGKRGIYPDGRQSWWCLDCRAEKLTWPWGDRVFSEDETFGYYKWPDPPEGYETCPCLACHHERRGSKVRRQDDGSFIVYIPQGGPTFPSLPVYVEASRVKCEASATSS